MKAPDLSPVEQWSLELVAAGTDRYSDHGNRAMAIELLEARRLLAMYSEATAVEFGYDDRSDNFETMRAEMFCGEWHYFRMDPSDDREPIHADRETAIAKAYSLAKEKT